MTPSTTIVNANTSYNNPSTGSIAREHHLNNGRRVTPISHRSPSPCYNFLKVVKVALLASLLFPSATALNWKCPTPQGSYLESCDRPVGYPYQSTDPYLVHVKFCEYTVSCKKVNKPHYDKRTSKKILPREDLACAKNWENCNGFLIGREGDERLCKDSKRITAELRAHGLLNERDEL